VSVKLMRTILLTLLCFVAFQGAVAEEAQVAAPAAVPADDPGDAPGDHADAPSRVARLSYKDGDVVIAPAGTEEWTDALLNRPLTTGDRVWVDHGSKAELQVGSATLYLDEGSGFSFVDLDDDLLHMSLTDGSATIRVRRKLDNESIEIETPNATVSLLHPGEYHIEVTEDGAATVVMTRSGESEVEGEKGTFTVRANEKGIFRGTNELTADIGQLGPRTAFEDWANDRERRDDNAVSAQYVSRDVVGYEDLDRNGEWISEPEYGYVWRPTYVAAGWAPYRFGRWVWVSPWGWSWVDNSPWGFAPFHYGRWAYARDRWCWVPGPRHIRPVYAPALVGWVGGSGVSVSVSFGSGVGWFPLGPREPYLPGYWHSRRYIHNVNVSNTYIVNNTYINNVYSGRNHFDYRYGNLPRAVTVVPRDRFVGGRPLNGHFMRVAEVDLRRQHHDGRAPAIAPDRNSVLASQLAARRPTMRPLIRPDQLDADRGNGQFLARRAAPERVSFDAERRAIEANQGRPVARSQIISNNPRAIARDRGDFRGASAQQRGGDVKQPERQRDSDRNTQVQESTPHQALQQSPESRVPNQSSERRSSDRPAWARQRVESDQSRALQSSQPQSRYERVQREDARNRALRENRNSPAQAGAAVAPAAAPQVNESRRESSPSWENRGNAMQDRVRASQPDRSSSSERSMPAQRQERPPSRVMDRPAPAAQPQYTAPREQPRAVREQPQVRQQAQPERSAPPRSTPQQQPRQQPQNDSKADRQSRDGRWK
jgi:hypothetical protein